MRYCFLLFLCILPHVSQAADFFFTTTNPTPTIGEPVTLEVAVNTDEVINAVAGTVVIDTNYYEIVSMSQAGSKLIFWIEEPREREAGKVSFSGITPGGFVGPAHRLLTVVVKPKQAGTSTVSMLSLRALLHDGLGTDTHTTVLPLIMMVQEGDFINDNNATVLVDTTPPEHFSPLIEPHPNSVHNEKVLIFSTTDSGAGINAYYVREYRTFFGKWFSSWKQAESPYILEDQTLQSYVEVKAIDMAGNERLVMLLPQYGYVQLTRWFMVGLGCVLIILFAWLITRLRANTKSPT